MARASVSVVVATYNRARLLPRLADALAAQDGAPAFEVVLVDNGSTDNTAEVLHRLAGRGSPTLRPLRLDTKAGPAPARNLGWRSAHGDLVVFTDDDCVPAPGWLAAMSAALEAADLVQGRTLTPPDQLPLRGWFDHHIEVTAERGFYESCNIGYRREVLERLGGFDERYQALPRRDGRPPMFGEDVDLGWRAREAGYRSAFEPEALVWHDVRPGGLRDRLREAPRREGMVLAVRRHPQLRDHLESRWFYQRSHPWAIAAAGGLVGLARRPTSRRRWGAAAVLAAPWLAYQGARVARGEWLTVLPRLFLADLAETAVLARASLRHRTFLL